MNRREFTNQFREALYSSGLSVEEAAKRLKTSPVTVMSWITGQSAPHPSVWRRTLEAMRNVG